MYLLTANREVSTPTGTARPGAIFAVDSLGQAVELVRRQAAAPADRQTARDVEIAERMHALARGRR